MYQKRLVFKSPTAITTHTVKYDNLVFTVLDVKDRRIGKIKVEKVEVEK